LKPRIQLLDPFCGKGSDSGPATASNVDWLNDIVLDAILPPSRSFERVREFIAGFHAVGFRGSGVSVGVVDSGFQKSCVEVTRATAATVDLTGEGMEDGAGHGTAVCRKILMGAPEARLIQVKVFTSAGRCAGGSEKEGQGHFIEAIARAAQEGAQLINVSAGLPRARSTDHEYLDSMGVCRCEICTQTERIALDHDVAIVVAAGNQGRTRTDDYVWSCPAAAAEVVPVIGLRGCRAIAAPPFAHNAVPADGLMLESPSRWNPISRWWRRLQSGWPRAGSSFATPVVASAASLVVQAFRARKARTLFLRNGKNPPHGTASGLADLQVFFSGRTWDFQWRDGHFAALEMNLLQRARKLVQEASYEDAEAIFSLLLVLAQIGEVGRDPFVTELLEYLGHLSMRRAQYTSAKSHFLRALEICDRPGTPWSDASVREGRAAALKKAIEACEALRVEEVGRLFDESDPRRAKAIADALDDPLDDS